MRGGAPDVRISHARAIDEVVESTVLDDAKRAAAKHSTKRAPERDDAFVWRCGTCSARRSASARHDRDRRGMARRDARRGEKTACRPTLFSKQMRELASKLATLPRVARADDEAIHDMRVALRRLRVGLKLRGTSMDASTSFDPRWFTRARERCARDEGPSRNARARRQAPEPPRIANRENEKMGLRSSKSDCAREICAARSSR